MDNDLTSNDTTSKTTQFKTTELRIGLNLKNDNFFKHIILKNYSISKNILQKFYRYFIKCEIYINKKIDTRSVRFG